MDACDICSTLPHPVLRHPRPPRRVGVDGRHLARVVRLLRLRLLLGVLRRPALLRAARPVRRAAAGLLDDRPRVHRAPDRRGHLRLHGRPARPPHDAAVDRRHHGRRDRAHRPAAHLRAGRLARRRAAGPPAHRAGPVARRRVGRIDPPRDGALRPASSARSTPRSRSSARRSARSCRRRCSSS